MKNDSLKEILVVDYEEEDRKELGRILKNHYKTEFVNSLEEAMETLLNKSSRISAVIIDLAVTQTASCRFMKDILENEALKSIPVIVATNSGDREKKRQAVRCGAWDLLSKPYDEDITLFRINNAIERSQLFILEQLRYLVEYDALTGIYNKSRFFKTAKQVMTEYPDRKFAVLHFDIDHFGMINSFFGRRRADKLLRYIADLLKELSTDFEDFIYARIEGDIFGICMSYDSKAEIEEFITHMESRLAEYRLDFDIVTTFGIFLVSDCKLTIEKMFYYAELAAWTAKSKYAEKFSYFEDTMCQRVETEHAIINEMKRALLDCEYTLYLQPKFDLVSGKPAGAEALARWNHKEKGMLSPALFIPIFEKNGFISKLDYYIWEQTCIQFRKWLDAGLEPFPISVNVSRVNLFNSHLVEKICELTDKYNIPHSLLQIELTESAYTDHHETMKAFLTQLHEHGFTCLMDDFGSGYSSLNILKDLPVDVLKIDMNFFAQSDYRQRSECIVESVVNMAKALNMTLIAEGVESAEQVNFLRRIGCDYVQGYYYGKPMPVEEYEEVCKRSVTKEMAEG